MTAEKMNGASLDVAADNRQRLKQLFPTVFTETVDANGKLVESVDFEKLKAELGTFTDPFANRRERYGMDWPGKKEALKLIQTVSTATLKPCREESVNFDTTENLFIEGDNLEVLKLLQKSYYGKVKMIYIDPPYNTGKEFIYPDNYSETLETYLEYAGLVDGDGKKFSTNTAKEGRFHTKWLNMMYPRLYLARNLLRDDGVIFISIDDNEITNLRKLCDEIYGEENWVGTIIWKNATDNNPTNIAIEHENIHVYAKSKIQLEGVWKSKVSDIKNVLVSKGNDLVEIHNDPEDLQQAYTEWFRENKIFLGELDRYKYIDKGGVYTGSQSVHNPGREGYRYDVPHPNTGLPCKEPLMGYRFPEKTMKELLDQKRILFGDDHTKIIELKVYAADYEEKLSSVFELDGRLGPYDLKHLFPELKKSFTNPKPVQLLLQHLPFVLNPNDKIIDFFAGSATTAHAVMQLNASDGGNRKFIMVQLPEPCPDDSEAFKVGFKTIADIGKERIRRVIKRLETEQNGKLPFDNASPQDRGFKVLKLDKSNFKQWQPLPPDAEPETLVKQLKLFIDHIDAKASPEDLLYEILIKAGFPPSERIETLTLAGKTVYSIAGNGLLLCLEDQVSAELINAVAAAEPMQFICLDAAFGGNDQLKANAVQTFAARNMGKEKHNQTVFKTV